MSVRILHGDVFDGLALLPDESVHCVVTSPPYWSLRDYGTAIWRGGDPACQHELAQAPCTIWANASLLPNNRLDSKEAYYARPKHAGGHCAKCGAVRLDRQIGLEATPGEYVETIVRVMREVRRVLRRDGTLWLNLGDSFAGSRGPQQAQRSKPRAGGLKPKDLIGIPWRVAFALQADGWWLRSEIVWAKPNCLPESVKDRPSSAHEKVFLLSKSRRYFYDAEAVREPGGGIADNRRVLTPLEPSGGLKTPHKGLRRSEGRSEIGRNLRNVWILPTAPFPGSHFATFPPAIPERAIKAGTSQKGYCPHCGKPWLRQTRLLATGQTRVARHRAGTERPARTARSIVKAARLRVAACRS